MACCTRQALGFAAGGQLEGIQVCFCSMWLQLVGHVRLMLQIGGLGCGLIRGTPYLCSVPYTVYVRCNRSSIKAKHLVNLHYSRQAIAISRQLCSEQTLIRPVHVYNSD